MNANHDDAPIKKTDPIWKRLYFDRVMRLLLLAWFLFYVIPVGIPYYLETRSWTLISTAFLPIFIIWTIIDHINRERYWTRISQRRHEALHDPQSYTMPHQLVPQDVLPLPITIRVHFNKILLISVIFMFIGPFTLGFGLAVVRHNDEAVGLGSFLAFITGLFGILFLLYYFIIFRFLPQKIEVTEDSITTTYMRQKRTMRWQDARTFATYDAEGIKKSSTVKTFELANETTVVRWSQLSLMNILMRAENNLGKSDYNRLIDQVNAIVAARTNLPLLDLSDSAQSQNTNRDR